MAPVWEYHGIKCADYAYIQKKAQYKNNRLNRSWCFIIDSATLVTSGYQLRLEMEWDMFH
jgi:hypothetical protein